MFEGVWNCIGPPEEFLLRVVVSYFLVLECRFAYLSLYLGFGLKSWLDFSLHSCMTFWSCF